MRDPSSQHNSEDEIVRSHAARRRLAERLGGAYVEDYVLGANDGIVTTFSVVAGATGGNLGPTVVLILGFANLFADGVSMAASNYLGRRSRHDYITSQRLMEEWEIDHLPSQEKDEVRGIFRAKGMTDEQAERAAEAISESKEAWVDFMLAYELGLSEGNGSPAKHGLATMIAFVAAGAVPLIPYFLLHAVYSFPVSILATASTLWATGALRTLITGVDWVRGGLEMLAIGSIAATIAYLVGHAIAWIV